MRELLEFIEKYQQFGQPSASSAREMGITAACEDIKWKLDGLLADKKTRWAIINELVAIDNAESMKEILKKRFK